MWICGNQKKDNFKDYNQEVKKLVGNLNDIEAKITLAKFLRANIGFAFQMISGVEMFPFQELLIKSILNRDVSLFVGARGISKSYCISILALMYPILYPNSKLCLISSNFRASRRILEEAEKMVKRRGADLLQACFQEEMKKGNDIYRWRVSNNSEVFCLPLSTGENLRGTRATCVIADEMVLISENIQNNIIKPFLTVKQNVQQQNEIKRLEDDLILRGVMTEDDRIIFAKNKFIGFSSASYEFQYLYTLYKNYIDNIQEVSDPKKEKDKPTYFVGRMSYRAIPENLLFDNTIIDSARANGGENSDYFKREYLALFTNSSDSYFSVRSMHDCTVSNGDYPTTQVRGNKDCEYVLSLDSSYSSSASSDYFGMGVFLINKSERKMILVHSYARAGAPISHHIDYLSYLLSYFNIVFIIYDSDATEFISGFSESVVASERGQKLFNLDAKFDTDDLTEYRKQLSDARRQYNLTGRRICYPQLFNSGSIRRMNEFLKNQIDAKKVWFASSTCCHEEEFSRQVMMQLPFNFIDNKERVLDMADFISLQDELINETKCEMALIEVRANSSTGNISYELPVNLKKLTSPDRPRRDLYTCMILGGFGCRIYFDLMMHDPNPVQNFYTPTLI